MAKEIKSVDVVNDAEEFYINIFSNFGWELKSTQRVYNQTTTPLGAITRNGVTYVHSSTETVDFTKLVFEREKRMENYSKLVELESEFWELAETVEKGKPYMPPNAKTMEDWARHFKPDLRTEKEKKAIHIKFGVIMAAFFIIIPGLAAAIIKEGSLAAMLIIAGAFAIGFIWKKALESCKKKLLESALQPVENEGRQRLKALYQEILEEINLYDQSFARMTDICCEAEALLDRK